MARQIFRQAALDRLASPERLDRSYRLVSVSAWAALAAVIGVTAAGVVWALFATAPVKVEGGGIVLPEEGLLEIVADGAGRIDDLNLRPGQTVAEGDRIAEFARTDLTRDLELAEAELRDARKRLSELEAYFAERDRLERQAENERLGTIRQTQGFAERRRQLMRQKIASLQGLVDRKIVIRDRLIDAELELAEARERLAGLDDEAKSIALDRLRRENEQALEILDEQREIERLKRAAEKIRRELSEKRFIASAHAGQVIEVRVAKGDVVQPGAPLAILAPPNRDADAGRSLGVLYLKPADGKRVSPGMAVEAEPSTVKAEEFGYVKGRIESVSPVPVSLAGMRSTLKNDELAKELGAGSAPFEARVRFETDPSTPSGLAWSSSDGPPAQVLPGTPLNARVVVERKRLIDLLAPGLGRLLFGDDA